MSSRVKTKQGAAAIMVVIIITMVTGIITLSFIRTMVINTNNTINYSSSDSAYNSALAGVEDAKVALLKYQKCRNENNTLGECGTIIKAIQERSGCDVLSEILYKGESDIVVSGEEVKINPGQTGSIDDITDQAYTCVKLNTKSNFLSELSESNPSRVFPVRIDEDDGGVNAVKKIRISWYGDEERQDAIDDGRYRLDKSINFGSTQGTNDASNTKAASRFDSTTSYPPAMRFELFQSGQSFSLDDFYSSDMSNSSSDRISLTLNPVEEPANGIYTNTINATEAARTASKAMNVPVDIVCSDDRSWTCIAEIVVPDALGGVANKNSNTMFARVSLPYVAPDTLVTVQFFDSSEKEILLNEVQAVIDSTGRAGDQFRRVEARVDMVNQNFPFPEYALTADSLEKSFWITQNCFHQVVNATTGIASSNYCEDYYEVND